MQKYTATQIKKLMFPNVSTETELRKWKRRFIVALTKEEKQKCRAKIKEYS